MKENPLEMLTQVRMLAGRVMAAFKVQYFCFICSTFIASSFIGLWPCSRSWVAEVHLSRCATRWVYGCFDRRLAFGNRLLCVCDYYLMCTPFK